MSAILDALLCVVSLGFSLWSFILGGSFFVAVWCFLLTQALFTLIPTRFGKVDGVNEYPEGFCTASRKDDRFARAYDVAERSMKELVRGVAL